MTGGWRDASGELVIAAIAAAALCGFACAFAGGAAALLTLAVCGVAALVALRRLSPPDETAVERGDLLADRAQTTFMGFWRRRAEVDSATRTMTGYDFELRATLQHLLAARLAERHGVSLYDDPVAARRLLVAGGSDQLWFWLDPGRPAIEDLGSSRGISLRTLAAIIDRLERL